MVHHASLLDACGDFKTVKLLPICTNSPHHAVMELFDDISCFRWRVKLREERPQACSVYAVKWLGEVNEHHVEVLMLFPALFLDLSSTENHVGSTAICSKPALRLRKDRLYDG